ncbi:response regulator [Oleiharenicola lentus]|uniref:response regulator n=1 Tax=Oleiharenicola lentus TaxID=2508720 RepID=UPI003F666584
MSLRVCIVDDDEPTRQILSELIRESDQLELVNSYADTESAVENLPKDCPDVVLMDINIPQINGIECVRRLKPTLSHTQFLMLTVYADANHIFAALAAGATGYLLKGTRRPQLLASIRQIAQGGSPMSAAIARKVVQSFAKTENERPDFEELSPRERSVLDLLSKGYLYKEIADNLNIKLVTVDTYVRRVYDKLQVNSRSQAIAKYLKR